MMFNLQGPRRLTVVSLSLLAMGLSGCASVNSVSLTPIPAARGQAVRAEVSKLIFLALNFNNDYLDPLVSELKRQCPRGVVTGILTKDETTSYILVFKKTVTATGFCVGSSPAKSGERSASNGSTDLISANESSN